MYLYNGDMVVLETDGNITQTAFLVYGTYADKLRFIVSLHT